MVNHRNGGLLARFAKSAADVAKVEEAVEVAVPQSAMAMVTVKRLECLR
jgi:hypothetical protein